MLVGTVLVAIPGTCFALNRADLDAACEAMNATYSTSSQRCVCKPGFTESNNACVPNGGSSEGSAGSGYDNGAAIREQQRRDEEQRQRDAEAEQQRRIEANKRRIEEAARQAKFLEDRDAAAGTLRGSTGASVSSSGGLRGSTATSGSNSLRGSSVVSNCADWMKQFDGSQWRICVGDDGRRHCEQSKNGSISRISCSGSSADSGLRGLRTGTTATPNTDPMVVDARNVPSGLPKSVDDAIPHTPSGERVRKGFQAVQDGDWKVALAWFKDALNKEPGDPGISRLVDLAQFTLDYRMRAKTPTTGKSSNPTQAPKQNTASQSTAATGTKPAGGVELAAASQMAARARADAAFKKYVEKYGERDAAGRASAVSKAARGEGYTNEELKAQLQKALEDYRKVHKKRDHSPIGGSPTADEIIVGGKG